MAVPPFAGDALGAEGVGELMQVVPKTEQDRLSVTVSPRAKPSRALRPARATSAADEKAHKDEV